MIFTFIFEFFKVQGHLVITKPLTHHPKFLIDNMVDNSWISISKIQLIIICIVQQLRLFDEIKYVIYEDIEQ